MQAAGGFVPSRGRVIASQPAPHRSSQPLTPPVLMQNPPALSPRPQRLRWLAALFSFCAALVFPAAAADVYWDFTSASPTSVTPPVANLTIGDVTQGNNNGVTPLINGQSVSNTYEGASAGNNAGLAALTGSLNTAAGGSAYYELTLTPASGFQVTVSQVVFGVRRTGTGPQSFSLRSNLDLYAADASAGGSPASGALPASGAWELRTVSGLNLSSGAPLTIRLYGYAGTGNPASGTANFRIDDLKVTLSVSTGGAPAPTLTSFTPATGQIGTSVTINGTNFGSAPGVSFTGAPSTGVTVNPAGTVITATVPVGAATGPITVAGPGGAVTSSGTFTVIATPTLAMDISPATIAESDGPNAASGTITVETAPASDVTITLASSDTTEATVPASVVLKAGEVFASFPVNAIADSILDPNATVTITASATGYQPASKNIIVTNTDTGLEQPTTVVVNKYVNGSVASADMVELLVIGNGTAGSTLDMRGMILKDSSADMTGDNGGKYTFSSDPLFAAVKAGTLIVLTNNATTTDTDPADFVLRLGMKDPAFFTFTNGWDIAGTEMVMIKTAASGPAGFEGAIHTLANGAEGSNFTTTAPKKLIAPGTTQTAKAVIANNSSATLADYNGSDASSNLTLPAGAFGSPNSAGNNQFIRQLRGQTNNSGDGLASIVNATSGNPFETLKNAFRRATPGQTVAISLAGQLPSGSLSNVKITVPAAFTAPQPGSVTVSGDGAGTPVISIAGREVTITGTAITASNTAVISLAGLTTPTPSALTDDGAYPFIVQTAGSSGAPAPIPLNPSALVSIPVASLRDVDEAGAPLDNGKQVVIEAICTVEDFQLNNTSGFVQDGAAGINIFQPGAELGLVRGNRYLISGVVTPFNGTTELITASPSDVQDLGAAGPVTPATLTVATLLATPELYEGSLVRVTNLSLKDGETDTFSVGSTITLHDGANPTDFLDIYIQPTSTATTDPAYPATITGIFVQFDTTTPFTSGYELCPRDPEDLGGSTPPAGYASWAAAYPGIGSSDNDADGDGQSNFLEYALGTVPNDVASVQPQTVTSVGGKPTFAITKGAEAGADPAVSYIIEGSTDLTNWSETTDLSVLTDTASAYSKQYTGSSGRFFFRLKVLSTP